MAKRFSSSKGPSQRQLRAGELIRHALVEIMQRETWRDPALQGVSITVSEVRVSPDLKRATAYASPLGGNEQGEVIGALNRVAPYLRKLLGDKVDLKYTPAISFQSDDTFAEAQKIEALLARPDVARDLGND